MDAHIWKSVFLTEKTWKVIMQHQLPIWYGVPGTVDQVRQLGFDTFDDILNNHQYDTVQNESERYQQVFELIANINQQYSLADCQQLRNQLAPRLMANYQQLAELSKLIKPTIQQYITEFINKQGMP
jgi:pantothenate kinase-related protein Tda10